MEVAHTTFGFGWR